MMKWACSPAYCFVRIAELSAIFKRIYEGDISGAISRDRFLKLSAEYEAEQPFRVFMRLAVSVA